MNYLEIKIEGTGEKHMLVQSLEEVVMLIRASLTHKLEKGVEWKDGITTVTIKKVEYENLLN